MTRIDDDKWEHILRTYWEGPLRDQLNNTTLLFARWEDDHEYIPPVWHKRIRNKIRYRIRDTRLLIAKKIAGYDFEDNDW